MKYVIIALLVVCLPVYGISVPSFSEKEDDCIESYGGFKRLETTKIDPQILAYARLDDATQDALIVISFVVMIYCVWQINALDGTI